MSAGVRVTLVVTLAAWAFALLYAALAGRVLYADGAYYVMVHFQNWFRFDDYDYHRSFANFISQAPILFGQKMGFERASVYAALYSLGAIAIPAFFMMAALVLVRRQPWLFAVTGAGCVVFGFCLNYINSEANLLFGLAWLCVAILAHDRYAPILRGFVLPLAAFVMLRTYEGMLLVGPVLAAWAQLAMHRTREERERIGLAIASVLFAIGAFIGFGGWLAPRDPANAQGFASSLFAFVRNPQVWLLASALLAIPAMLAPARRVILACGVLSAAAGIAFIVMLARVEGYMGYIVYYENRTFLAFLLPAFVAVALLAYWQRPTLLERFSTMAYGIILVPLLFAIAGDIMGTRRWSQYMHEFCVVLNQPDMTPAERLESLKATGVVTGWSWTHPTMSVLLRPRGSDAIVANEPGLRFDPPVTGVAGLRGFCEAPILGALWK